MQGYLISVAEVWRVDDNEAADRMEEEFRADETYTLTKWAKADKNKKQGGEIVEEWVQVNATKVFNDMKNPDSDVRPSYQ